MCIVSTNLFVQLRHTAGRACTIAAAVRCRRGVGPKPIAIDSLTEDKLVAALEFMADPQVKARAEAISAELAQVLRWF
jgi:hypothetical protein